MVNDFINRFFENQIELIKKISPEIMERMAGIILEAWNNDRTIFIAGNGGSASTATHLACDLAKCTIVGSKKRLRVLSLTDNIPLVSAWTNDNGFAVIYEEQLKNLMHDNDMLIVFSVHGGSGEGEAGAWSQNLPRAVEYVKKRNGKVLAFSGFGGGFIARNADECITIAIESEPLGTPLVESLHSALAHLLAQCVRIRIEKAAG